MKGEAENIDISNEVIDSLINITNAIYTVQFMGGEPMLAIDKIRYFLEAAKKKEVVIFGLSLITNGTILNDEVISVLKEWHNYIKIWCDEDIDPCKLIVISVSTDYYHGEKAHQRFEQYGEALEGIATVLENKGGEIPYRMGRATKLSYAFPMMYKEHKIAYRIGEHNINNRCTENFKTPTFTSEQVIVMCEMELDIYGQFVPIALYSNTDHYKPISCVINNTAHGIISDIDKWNEDKPCCKDLNNKITALEIASIISNHDDPEAYFYKWAMRQIDLSEANNTIIEIVYKLLGLKSKFDFSGKQINNCKALYGNAAPLFKMFPRHLIDKFNHDKLMETAAPETKETINNDEIIKLIKETLSNSERLIQLFPENSTYQAMLESDKKSLLYRELQILKEAKQTDQSKHPAIKTTDGLRCGYCGKVIQHQGRNIHCAPVEGGLQCQYCKSLNTV